MHRILLLCLGLALPFCAAAATPPAIDARLRDPVFQYEILRYCYLWYLNDQFFVAMAKETAFELWFRPVNARLPDPGDESRYAEVWIPAAQLQLQLKLADYPIPELQRRVRSPGYRITRAELRPAASRPREDYAVFSVERDRIRSYFADVRTRAQLPEAGLRARLVAAMKDVVKLHPPARPAAPQTFFVSTVLPVSGDLWVVWANEQVAIRFGGELGADAADLLEVLPLHTQLYDLKRQVVASLLETEGRTGFITKDWAGRILFQCLVLGERVEVSPATLGLDPASAPPRQ
jgi:hypothetical protein